MILKDTKKQMILFDENKKEEKIELNSIEDIYKFKSQLINSVSKYISV